MSEATKALPCPQCGEAASGNFCQNCGTTLGGRFCNQCGTKVAAGAKFCGECGTKVAGGSAPAAPARPSAPAAGTSAAARAQVERRDAAAEVVGGQNLAWWIAGAAMFALIVVVGLNMVRPGPPAPPTTGGVAAPAAGGGVAPDISQMSPIEAADRLFNRVMQSVSAGDSTAAQQFLPMAIAAYNRARPLTLDGLFHLSMLNRTAGNLEAALDNALEIVGEDPNHLLGLAAAAEAAIELGELDEAETHYRHLADIYDAEVQRPLEEYQMHSAIVDVLKQDAERFLGSR